MVRLFYLLKNNLTKIIKEHFDCLKTVLDGYISEVGVSNILLIRKFDIPLLFLFIRNLTISHIFIIFFIDM